MRVLIHMTCLLGHRWSHNGSVACSFENNRLFGQYRNGAIAAVVDPGGNGTVMNPRGKCVLNLRVTGGGEGRVAEVLSDNDGSVLHLHEKGVTPSEDQQLHEWKFQNMTIVFDPIAWELRVSVTNSRSVSCFSSIHGGKLMEGSHVYVCCALTQLLSNFKLRQTFNRNLLC